MNDMIFNYFTAEESEQFSFVRVPKVFFTDKRFETLSYGAKILYGLLLDRMSLSRKNKWYDDRGRVYVIYKIESIQEDFNVSKSVAVRFMREVEMFGLIEKKRRPNAPTMIYVKNFILAEDAADHTENTRNQGSSENGLPEVQKTEVQHMNFRKNAEDTGSLKSGLPKSRLPEVQNMDSNKTNLNNTDNYILMLSSSKNKEKLKMMIEERIHYKKVLQSGNDEELANKIVNCLVEFFCSEKADYRINGCVMPAEQVKAGVMGKLSEDNFILILSNIQEKGNGTIHNFSSYILTCFYSLEVHQVQRRKADNSFGCFLENEYDFDKLEKELLAN